MDAQEPIRIFNESTTEYRRLQDAAREIRERTILADAHVGETYFDHGQDWRWTTILATSPRLGMPFQILSPARQRAILYGSDAQRDEAIRQVVAENNARYVPGTQSGMP